MRSRLDAMRRTLNSAIAAINAKDNGSKQATTADDPAARLRGLEKEAGSILSEVNNLRGKQDRAERYEFTDLDKLDASIADLNERVEAGLRDTASARRETPASGTANAASAPKKKKPGFIGRLLGRGDDNDKYAELVGTVAPGRDRQLFEEATLQARKDRYETARDLYNVIITTYPESDYLPLAKLAIADTFYLEGTTSALIQAGATYQDWYTFFPTHPLADDVLLKMAEVEMRKMGLPDRDVSAARKGEQRIKVLFQQFPNTSLRPEAEIKMREIQENLGMHSFNVGNFYYDRYIRGAAPNPKGAQSRYREIVEKYPNFSFMDEVLYRLAMTYVAEEEPDEATKYFAQLARDYPNSQFAEKTREQLEAIGAAVPAPDPSRMNVVPPERPSFTRKLISEMVGTTPVTVDKNGILINKGDKGGDLIDQAISNGGRLPTTTPTIPVSRRPPARPVASTTPAPKQNDGGGISIQPTQPGAPQSGSDPAQPPATQITTPATAPARGSETLSNRRVRREWSRSDRRSALVLFTGQGISVTQTTTSVPDEFGKRHRAAALVVGAMFVLTVFFILLAASGVYPDIRPTPMLDMGLRIGIVVFILGAVALRRTRLASARLRDIAAVRGIPSLLGSLQKTTVFVALIGGAIALMGYILSAIAAQNQMVVMLVVGAAAILVLLSCYPRRAVWERVLEATKTLNDEGLPPSKGTIA